jgi:CBS domain containing-hemolysin-like protein
MEVTTKTAMLSGSMSLWLGSVGGLLAVLLSTTWMVLTHLSRGTVRRLEQKEHDLARQLEGLLNRRDDFRVLVRLLLIADFVLLAFCVTSWLHHCRETASLTLGHGYGYIALGVLLYLLVSEFLGQHLSWGVAGRFLLWSTSLVRVLGIVVLPLAWPLILVHRRLDSWQEKHGEEEEKTTTEDEILSLVEQAEEQVTAGANLEEDERRMIRGIFDLDETLVREIMTPRVDLDAVEDTADLDEIKAGIVESGHSRIPVYHDSVDHIVGVIYAKDLLDEARMASVGSIGEIYHCPVFIPESKNVGDLLAEFQQSRIHFAVVLDEYGGTAGVVTFEDILEEIVGEIQDEYDLNEVQPTVERLPDGSLLVDARTLIEEVNEQLDVELPDDEDYDTIGGYISAETGRIPQKGEHIETELVRVEIVEAEPRRVLKVKVTPRSQDGESGDE